MFTIYVMSLLQWQLFVYILDIEFHLGILGVQVVIKSQRNIKNNSKYARNYYSSKNAIFLCCIKYKF